MHNAGRAEGVIRMPKGVIPAHPTRSLHGTGGLHVAALQGEGTIRMNEVRLGNNRIPTCTEVFLRFGGVFYGRLLLCQPPMSTSTNLTDCPPGIFEDL